MIFSTLLSGRYQLQLNEKSELYSVYCHMESLDDNECSGGGWTWVLTTSKDEGTNSPAKVCLCFSYNLHHTLSCFLHI